MNPRDTLHPATEYLREIGRGHEEWEKYIPAFETGNRLRFKERQTVWEVLEVHKTGCVICVYSCGFAVKGSHKRLYSWLELAYSVKV